MLFDENKEMIFFDDASKTEAIDRDNNKFEVTIKLDSEKDKEFGKNIKYISLYSDSGLELILDKKMKIDLKK